MSETNCSVHQICMWELALEGAKRNAETAIHRMEKSESELTKLRKRVEVLQEALSFYGNPESWIIRDKHYWRKSSPKSQGDDELIKDYHHPNRDWIGTVVVGGKRARQALAESAKIAEGK